MSDLVVIAYDDEFQANEVLHGLRRLQTEYLVDLEDAVVVTKSHEGKTKLHQSVNLTATGAVGGVVWGSLVGLLFMNPILGGLVGAGIGALSGSLTDYGINDNFIKELSEVLSPDSSAIFILLRKSTYDKVIPELGKFGGTVLKTSLPHDLERKLREGLGTGQESA